MAITIQKRFSSISMQGTPTEADRENNAQAKPGNHRHANIQDNISLDKYYWVANDHNVS
jgi:hypothetical protein